LSKASSLDSSEKALTKNIPTKNNKKKEREEGEEEEDSFAIYGGWKEM
jgi:hypothetical protein